MQNWSGVEQVGIIIHIGQGGYNRSTMYRYSARFEVLKFASKRENKKGQRYIENCIN